MLSVFTLEGIGHQVFVDEDLGVESVLLLELLDFDIVTFRLDPSRRHLDVCVNGLCGSTVCLCVSGLNALRICVCVNVWIEQKANDRWCVWKHNRGEVRFMSLGCIAVIVHMSVS